DECSIGGTVGAFSTDDAFLRIVHRDAVDEPMRRQIEVYRLASYRDQRGEGNVGVEVPAADDSSSRVVERDGVDLTWRDQPLDWFDLPIGANLSRVGVYTLGPADKAQPARIERDAIGEARRWKRQVLHRAVGLNEGGIRC